MPRKKREPTSEEAQTPTADPQQLVFKRPPSFLTYYANNTNLMTTRFDLSLAFGRLTGEKEDGKPVIEQAVQITLSYEHAKAMVMLVAGAIQEREVLAAKAEQEP